jgi:hypothetical protein
MKRILVITILLVSSAAWAMGQTTITVDAEVAVNDKILTIGSIARVESDNQDTVAAIQRIRLGFSPMPGSWRELDRDIINDQLSINGFSTKTISINAPRLIRVHRRSQVIDGQSLEGRLRDFILSNAPWAPEEMMINDITNAGTIALPQGDISYSITPRGDGDYLGHETFVVQISIDGKEAKRILLQAHIRVMRETLVAARTITAREIIGEADLEYRRMDISSTRGDASITLEEAVGMASRSYIRAGQVITRNIVSCQFLSSGAMWLVSTLAAMVLQYRHAVSLSRMDARVMLSGS